MVGGLDALCWRRAIKLRSFLGACGVIISQDGKRVVGALSVAGPLKTSMEIEHTLLHALPTCINKPRRALACAKVRDSVLDRTAHVILAAIIALVRMRTGAVLA